jgi:hypothetical protein
MQPQAAPENSVTIQWHPALLGRLWELVSEQPNGDQGPRECGGLLLGAVERDGNRVQITVRLYTPISCSYQNGQLYHLTRADKAILQQSIALYASPFWSCVGFYRSHRRPDLKPDEEDLQLARDHLKDPPSIFLVLAANGSQGSVFLFDGLDFSKDPVLPTADSQPVSPGASAPNLQQKPSGRTNPRPAIDVGEFVAEGLALASRLQATVESASKRMSANLSAFIGGLANIGPGKKSMPGWLVATLIVAFVGLFAVWNQREWPPPASNGATETPAALKSSIGLATSVELDHLRVTWNPQAPSVARASHGTLLVNDGQVHKTISLDAKALAHGSFVYYPTSDLAIFEVRIGDVTESLVTAGLERLVAAQPVLPQGTKEQERAPEHDQPTQKNAGPTRGTTSNVALRNNRHPVEQKKLSASRTDSGSERIRSKYEAPPNVRRALPVPQLLQPPDSVIAVNPLPSIAVQLPVTIPLPPPAPEQSRSESAASGPREHVDFVAAQTIKHVSPQASGNALRLLVTSVTIRVQVHINSQGKVVRADSLSHGGTLVEYLANLSINAAREWLFAPARREGRAVDSDTVLQFVFDNQGIQSSL